VEGGKARPCSFKEHQLIELLDRAMKRDRQDGVDRCQCPVCQGHCEESPQVACRAGEAEKQARRGNGQRADCMHGRGKAAAGVLMVKFLGCKEQSKGDGGLVDAQEDKGVKIYAS
jgi:hypothetical protein